MTEVLVQGTKGVKRRRTLEPYLLKVQEVLRREPLDPTRSRRLSIDGVALSIEPWVIASVEPQGGAPDGNTDRAELLGQSLALWLKTALDVRNLRRETQSGSENLYEAQAKLMLDSALGTSLLQELQRCVDGLVQQGDLEEAKRLSKFRGQVSGLVRELKQVISESNGPAIAEIEEDEPGEQPRARPAPPALAKSLPSEPDPGLPTPVRRPRPRPAAATATASPRPASPAPEPSGYRTQILVVLDIAALVAWVLLTMPSRMHGQTPPVLSAKDFENSTALVEVAARPPALYAAVDESIWSAYDAKQQRRFIDSMGNVLLTHGYWGLSLRTTSGRLVGEWLEKGGTRLLEVAPDGPRTPGHVSGQYSRFVP